MKTRFNSIFKFFTFFVLLALTFGALGSIPAQAAKTTTDLPSVEQFLNADGTLNTNTNYIGNLDIGDYSVTVDPMRGPILSPPMTVTPNVWNALGTPFLTNTVKAIAVSGTDIYIGGYFLNAGGDANADYIAKWNGTTWSALGTTPLNNKVEAIAVSGTDIYVGGDFLNAGGDANADHIAKWNGTTWSALGTTPVPNRVNAIAISGTDVYIGGDFFTPGLHIAKWNGTNWSGLGAGLNYSVFAIAVSGADVYAGGGFSDAGGDADADYIAKWNGTAWSALGTSIFNGDVYAIAISGTDVYVGGSFVYGGYVIAKFDGTTWTGLGNSFGFVNDIVVSGTDVYATGTADQIVKWNGSAWSALGATRLNNGVKAIAISGTNVYAGGDFTDAGGDANADYVAMFVYAPEINIKGNSTSIVDGDTTPSASNHTDFGSPVVTGGTVDRTFTIENTGNLNLTLSGTPKVVVSGTNAADFSVTTQPISPVTASGTTTFIVHFDPSALGTRTASLSIDNDDTDENPYNFDIQGTGTVPEMNIKGNNLSIADGDITPSADDYTDFGSAGVSEETIDRTFTIENTGDGDLTLNGTPKVVVSGTNAGDFSVTTQPTSPVTASSTTTFIVHFNPSASGVRTASLSIDNDDADENPYNFDIQGTGTVPEMNIKGNNLSIADGDTTPFADDYTDFGSAGVPDGTIDHIFTIENIGDGDLTLNGTPKVVVSGTNAADFSVATQPTSPVTASGTTTFIIHFNPSALGVRTASLSIDNNDSDENPYNFDITGTGVDITNPISTMTALPATSPANISLAWSGSDTLSGVSTYDVQVRAGAGGIWTDVFTNTSATSTTYNGIAGVTYYFRTRAKDVAGNIEDWPPDYDTYTMVDTDAPTGTLVINSGALSTTFTGVKLTLSAQDVSGSVAQMSFSNDATSWDNWQTYTGSINWSLLGGDGLKTVYVRFKDIVGNVSSPTSSTITLDTAVGTEYGLSVNQGALFTNQADVTLSIAAKQFTPQVMISNDGGFASAIWEPYNSFKPWTITQYGSYVLPRVVYVRYKDTAGNVSATYQDDIILDVTPPTGTVSVTGVTSGLQAAATAFTLKLSATDDVSGVGKMMISNRPDFAGAVWEDYVTSRIWAVGSNTAIYYKFQDNAGNASATKSIKIPKQNTINGGFNTYTGASKVPSNWSALNFSVTDGKDKSVKEEGVASVKIIGTTGKTKTLTQTLNISGTAGNAFIFSYWAKGTSLPMAGICQGQVSFYNGAILKGTKTLKCPTGKTYTWKNVNLSFSAPAAYTKVEIKFTYSKTSGTIWFDLASLLK